MFRWTALAAAALAAAIPLPAHARPCDWTLRTHDAPRHLAVDPGGDVSMTSSKRPTRARGWEEIVKVDGQTGRRRWHHRIRGTGSEAGSTTNALLAMDDGDVVAAGEIRLAHEGSDFMVVRLDAREGHERWRQTLRGLVPGSSYETAHAVTADAAGDVIAGGSLVNSPAGDHGYGDFTVAKLAGGTGTERWRFTLEGPGGAVAEAVAVDTAGDVVAAGEGGLAPAPVAKVDGRTGALLWRRVVDFAFRIRSVAVDASGDVVVAMLARHDTPPGNDFAVAKLSGVTGEILWVARESRATGRWQEAFHVLVDGTGAVFAVGIVNDGTGEASEPDGENFTVVRLDGTTGARTWIYRGRGTDAGAFARDLAFGAPGFLVASGSAIDATTCGDGLVVVLDAVTGTPVWSRTIDGSFATPECRPRCEKFCPAVDNDDVTAMAVGNDGVLFLGASVHQQRTRYHLATGVLRRVSVPYGALVR